MLQWGRDFLATGAELFDTLLAPPFCEHCYRPIARAQIFCASCRTKINLIATIELKVTPRYHVRVLAISDYAAPLQKLILAKNGANSLASRQLAELIWQYTSLPTLPVDYLVPLPLHWTRRCRRGFNQTEIMAHRLTELARLSAKINPDALRLNLAGLSAERNSAPELQLSRPQSFAVADILQRTHRTQFQAELKPVQRWQNLQQVLQLKPLSAAERTQFKDRDLVLVDDLMTTGATLTAAAKVLAQLRPRSISAVVACRVLK